MNVLAIETSVPEASLSLSLNGDTVFSTSWHAERNHDAHLFPALKQALDALPDSEKLDYLLVGAGPGSYGGVRVALAAGVGITTVTGARLVAVESWAQLAEGEACIVADARRGGWTVRRPGGDIEVLSTEELLALRNPIFTVEAAGTLPARGIDQVQREALVPSAEGLIRTWMALDDTQRRSLQEKPAEPIYVRPPHITTSTRKPWEI